MNKPTKINWRNVLIGIVVEIILIVIAVAILCWVTIWQPELERRAMEEQFDAFVERLERERNLKLQ